MNPVSIRSAPVADAAAIAAIYNHHVLHSIATFEQGPVAVDSMTARMQRTLSMKMPWLVATNGDSVSGSAHAGACKSRGAYRHGA